MSESNEVKLNAELKEKSANSKSGYWQVPYALVKQIRKLTQNELRQQFIQLAAALVDQRNANVILSDRVISLEEEIKSLKNSNNQEMTKDGQNV